jgi:hypothetical protein
MAVSLVFGIANRVGSQQEIDYTLKKG